MRLDKTVAAIALTWTARNIALGEDIDATRFGRLYHLRPPFSCETFDPNWNKVASQTWAEKLRNKPFANRKLKQSPRTEISQ